MSHDPRIVRAAARYDQLLTYAGEALDAIVIVAAVQDCRGRNQVRHWQIWSLPSR